MDKTLAQQAELGRRITQAKMQANRVTRPHLHNQHVMTEIEVRCNFERTETLPHTYKWTGFER